MGQKAHPIGLRLGIIEDWSSSWFDIKNYPKLILEDIEIRKYIEEEFKKGGLSEIKISRKSDKVNIDVKASRTGVLLGQGGSEVERHRDVLSEKLARPVFINIVEEKDPEKSARLLAESICLQLEKRIAFRRAMKMIVGMAMKAGAIGVKVSCSGRLGGVEIARTEWYREGKVPLHTLRAKIDYSFREAFTTYGKIGVKVWVYHGDIIDHKELKKQKKLHESELTEPEAA